MKTYTLSVLMLLAVAVLFGQKVEPEQLRTRIEQYKSEERGPYRDIRWFCKDGSFVMPKEKCPEPGGGVQRARYKEEVIQLGKSNHIFLGQILSTTAFPEFWDAANYNARLKQYQLEKYLRSVDDGWILRKAQYYRGAYQVEDEAAWGIDFFNWLLQYDEVLERQFFLVRQAVKDIPHQGEDNKTMEVRAVSKAISDAYPAFMDLRVKIHGQPDAGDVAKVKAFRQSNETKLTPKLQKQFEQLIADMEYVYRPIELSSLNRFIQQIPKEARIRTFLEEYVQSYENSPGKGRAMATADLLSAIRTELLTVKGRKARLALLDISNALEGLFFQEVNQWQPQNLGQTTEKICYTGLAAMGTGFIEIWEWQTLLSSLAIPPQKEMTLDELNLYLERARSLIEWGTGMVNGVYKEVVNLYGSFEPLANGFYDDRIRASVLLPLGNTVGALGSFIAQQSNLNNNVLRLSNQSTIRGLNPGFAMGELVVVKEQAEEMEVSKDKIYVFYNPPSDLKPVAGILTVTEGNMVSHVQLLARNLGIPNAVLSVQNKEDLNQYHGQQVFYAVSNRGTVIMKPAAEMTNEETTLFQKKARSEERITVPVEKIQLNQTAVLNMRTVDASLSGKVCGPKAANLGQLKAMFPENVVEGIVLPFGVFRQHLDQAMPGQTGSYWAFLNSTFDMARHMENTNCTEEEVESYTLGQLEVLREGLKNIQLLPEFVQDLEQKFQEAFGKEIGQVPVFLRSDTNMEDLKDFTGAGLNLTLFNVVDRDKIIQGVKDVWASPYTERSFKWRQRYLLNPENVFPSILIIPSVDVDYSGVLITKGIPTADSRDRTIAFSRGAGGAVDGQAAESYLIHHQGFSRLLSPAREPMYRTLPETGGSKMLYATFEQPILNGKNLADLGWLANRVHELIPQATGSDYDGPYDVELGFKENKIWLFQIRPFVENKNALNSAYLESITPKVKGAKSIRLESVLQ